jgi:CMP/dCMP kinase
MIITIDGPVASGKSTVSRILARELGDYYLCSGLLYRALGYLLINRYGYTLETITHVTDTDITNCLDPDRFVYCYAPDTQERIFFDRVDITAYLKDRFMDKVSSVISVNERVRRAITTIQRHIGSQYDLVIDGRDVGSVVFPYAEVKFFITASVEIRADRWRKDQEKYGNHFSHDDAVAIITDRDERDKNRTIAPLIIPHNAIIIDTSDLDVMQTIKKMVDTIKNYSQSVL